MKRIMLTIENSGDRPRIPELNLELGMIIDGSFALKSHGLGFSEVRNLDDALQIVTQIVDAVNAQGGLKITDLEYAYRFKDCPTHHGWDVCNCGRFDTFK